MESSMSAKWVQFASIAILALFLAPLAVHAPEEARRYVLAEIGGIGPGPVRASGADVVSLGTRHDLAAARRQYPAISFQGNVDEELLRTGTPY